MKKICKIENCLKPMRAKGLCNVHYHKEYDKIYSKNNNEKIKNNKKTYHIKNKIAHNLYAKNYSANNKEEKKLLDQKYRLNNKEYLKGYFRNYVRIRRASDFFFKLRNNISNIINKILKSNSSSKNGKSVLKFLSYTIQELKSHLEPMFESWMTWDNYGKYNSETWDDNDQSTWTWNLDHIIPQSDLPYISMEDENFKKCWSLDNLRPLSAKQNQLDGVTKIRHNHGLS